MENSVVSKFESEPDLKPQQFSHAESAEHTLGGKLIGEVRALWSGKLTSTKEATERASENDMLAGTVGDTVALLSTRWKFAGAGVRALLLADPERLQNSPGQAFLYGAKDFAAGLALNRLGRYGFGGATQSLLPLSARIAVMGGGMGAIKSAETTNWLNEDGRFTASTLLDGSLDVAKGTGIGAATALAGGLAGKYATGAMTERFLQSQASGRLTTVLTYAGSGYGSGFASGAVDSGLRREHFDLAEVGTVLSDAHKGGMYGAATGSVLGLFAPRLEAKTVHRDVEKVNDAPSTRVKTVSERPPSWVISFRARDEVGKVIPNAIAVEPTLYRFGSNGQIFSRSPQRFLKEVAVAAERGGKNVIVYKHGSMNQPFEAALDASLIRGGAAASAGGKGPAIVAIDLPTNDPRSVGYLEFLPRLMDDIEHSRHLHPKIIEATKDVIGLIREKEMKATVIGHSVGAEGAIKLAEHMTKQGIKVNVVVANPHLTDGTIVGPATGIHGEIDVLNHKDNASALSQFAQKRLARRFFELTFGRPFTSYVEPKEVFPTRTRFGTLPTTDVLGHSPDMNALGRYVATPRDTR